MRITPANCREETQLVKLLRMMPKIPNLRGRVRTKPEAVYGDRGYGFPWIITAVERMGIVSKLAPRGSEHGSGLGKKRYVVERSLANLGHCRRLKLCYEKTEEHFQAFHELAMCLLCFKRLQAA